MKAIKFASALAVAATMSLGGITVANADNNPVGDLNSGGVNQDIMAVGCSFTVITNNSWTFAVRVNNCSAGKQLRAVKPYYRNDIDPRLYYINGTWVGSAGSMNSATRPGRTLDGGSGILQYS